MNILLTYIESVFPKYRNEIPKPIREYYQFKEHLYSVDGVILYKERIVVPPSLREEVLVALHAAHQGITAMASRAESSVFWPGITSAITALHSRCQQCNRMAPSQPSAPPHRLYCQLIRSSASVRISSTTKEKTT